MMGLASGPCGCGAGGFLLDRTGIWVMTNTAKIVEIYTDGACSGNPGPGGWGTVLIYQARIKEISGYEADTTNNRMEILAAIMGLELLKEPCHVKLYSDSALLVNTFTLGWIQKWQRKGWMKAPDDPVKNRDLWERLVTLSAVHRIEWIKVKGHSGNHYNERCDALARAAIQENRVAL